MREGQMHVFKLHRKNVVAGLAGLSVAALIAFAGTAAAGTGAQIQANGSTATPIKHLVVIFQENVSFDHYFGTYPTATNTSGQPFDADHSTPSVNNLADTKGAGGQGTLLTNN